MKANKRAQYRRNWAAAARTLRQADCCTTTTEHEDSTELVELSSPGNSNSVTVSESELEDPEPVLKCRRTLSDAHCSSTDNSIDLDAIRPDPCSSFSDSEDI